MRKPPGYWDNWDNLRRELEEVIRTKYRDKKGNIIKEAGEFPTQSQLKRIKKYPINDGIKRHGNYPNVRKLMGFEESKRRPNGYWYDWNNLKTELHNVILNEYKDAAGNLLKKAGEVPSIVLLSKINHSLGLYIYKHGNYEAVLEKAGYESLVRPNGYWKVWDNLVKELMPVINSEFRDDEGTILKEAGKFPTNSQLEKIGKSAIANAISDYHGNYSAVKKKMGYALAKRPYGYWDNWNNLVSELGPVIKAEICDDEGNIVKMAGEFPTQTQLRKLKLGYLHGPIQKHGGKETVQRKMTKKFKKRYKPINTLEDLQDFVSQEEVAMEMIQFAGSNSYLSDAIEILAKKYPHRIKDASKFSRLVIESHVSLAQFVGPYSAPKGEHKKDYLGILFTEFGNVRGFDELAFAIVRDENMKEFNVNPRYVLGRLEAEVGREENEYVRGLLERVRGFYKEIFELEIPGILSLRENPRYME